MKNNEPLDMFGNPLEKLVSGLGVTALVMAGQEVALDTEPEEGEAGVLAQALDALESANLRAARAEKAALEAAELAAEKMNEIELAGGSLDDAMAEKLKIALKARKDADTAARKALKEQAKSTEAAKEAEALGIQTDTNEKHP